ncbi:Glutamate synthase [Ectopseudomonas oleovorans]|nr:Glutamate synthase [Pseudomonas oleovorans]
MIDTLSHLPRPDAGAAELADRFSDLAPPLTARQAALESARCLYCYDAPCVNACPSEIDIPSFIRNISHENVQGAAEKILSANILGGSCARVCPTEILCQQACVRNNTQECAPVLIGLLQRYAIDNAQFSEHPFQRAPASGKRIAVVGAGPAGLSCAHRLAMHGHEVVIFEAREKAGGLNEYGIAKYKLVDDFAQREVEFLLQIGGIEIRHGHKLGDDLSLSELHQQFDAVFLGIGLAASKRLGLPGEEAPGLLAATDYIRELRQSDDLTQLPVAERCIVLGAGNTAIDMAVQMSKLGARDVNLVPIAGASRKWAPPHTNRTSQGQSGTPADLGTAGRGAVERSGSRCAACASPARVWRTAACKAPDKPSSWPQTPSSPAIGQAFDGQALNDPLARELKREGERIWVDAQLQTSVPGVYAGGDCTALGQDLTVQAVPARQSWPPRPSTLT